MNNLTLIIPAKNEKESLPHVLEELKGKNIKVHVILEEIDQKTIKSISNFECKIIFQKERGYGDALIEGINSVDTKYFCIFNADGSFDPSEINSMLKKKLMRIILILFLDQDMKKIVEAMMIQSSLE